MTVMDLRDMEIALGRFHLNINVSFSNGITGIFGASGAGKTTLLEIIAGLRKPLRGQQSLNGEVLFDAEKRIFLPAERRRIGYVPQDLALFPHLSVEENIRYGEKASGSANRNSFEVICSVLDIEKSLAQSPSSLSGGEKQRVALARALMAGPRLLLLDEPLSGLDSKLKEKIIPFILRIRDEFAIPMIYVTHSPEEIMALCGEVILLDHGKIARKAIPSEVFVRTDAPVYRLRDEVSC